MLDHPESVIMDRYTELRSFVLVAEKGSFAAAALVEGVAPVVMGRRQQLSAGGTWRRMRPRFAPCIRS